MTQLFLYGLFMDIEILESMGLSPEVKGKAQLSDYRIQIGDRATLVPAENARAYGLLVCLTESEVELLYSSPSVAAYQRSEIEVTRMDNGESEAAIVYNLPSMDLGSEVNRVYANDLARLVRELDFPSSYAHEIEANA